MFGDIGLPEILIILFIVLLIFGANKLPQLGRSLGSSIGEFKKGLAGSHETAAAPPAPVREEPVSTNGHSPSH
ncbi:MAG: twin-arginine translocase TatA/TatE family subunit [Chloroflexi bacterium]|nr:twin-arginine translocase TatA/TatE family subunit [Chloroflexota bacterium]